MELLFALANEAEVIVPIDVNEDGKIDFLC